MTAHETELNTEIRIRRIDVEAEGIAAVARLAELESRPAPAGPLLGAEVEGRLLAAISLVSGEMIADPFSRTSELRALLNLRRTQLQQRAPRRGGRRSRLWGRRSRPAVGGSPAGQIIALPRVN